MVTKYRYRVTWKEMSKDTKYITYFDSQTVPDSIRQIPEQYKKELSGITGMTITSIEIISVEVLGQAPSEWPSV